MKLRFTGLSLLLALCSTALAQKPAVDGAVTGIVFDPTSGKSVEFATVAVKGKAEGKSVRVGATDAKGGFELEAIPAGDYLLVYGLVGGAREATVAFSVDARRRTINLGRLPLNGDAAVQLAKVEVSARQATFYNSIDRKVYNVGKDIQSLAGSVSDLLQNVPSVQVDIEGNVSLRGDSNVLILVNLGLRHNFADKRTALTFTVSDVFGSLRERTHIDTPGLRQDIIRRRSSRIAYLGLIYNFGKPTKKPKKDDLQFDNTL